MTDVEVVKSTEPTEVRCQEKTRGGLRYEVILSEPEVKVTPPKKAASPKNSMSVQDIEDKLKAAEERRQQLESNKIAALAAKMQKIEDASRKKDEQTSQFISATRDALEQKMENHTEKREAYITDLKTKLKVIVARESSADGCYKARV
jgi:stathmin